METECHTDDPQADVGGPGSIEEITFDQSQTLFYLQDGGADSEDDWMRRGRNKGACSLPPRQGGGAGLLLQLKVEGGGARALWRAVFPGNRKEVKKRKKRGGTLPPGTEKVKRETANWRRTTGDDAIKKRDSNRVMSQ